MLTVMYDATIKRMPILDNINNISDTKEIEGNPSIAIKRTSLVRTNMYYNFLFLT